MKKLVLATAILLTAVLAAPANAAPGEPSMEQAEMSWSVPKDSDAFSDMSKLWYSILFTGGVTPETVPRVVGTENGRLAKLCEEIDSTCLATDKDSASGLGLFQLCSVSKVAPCVESLEYQTSTGEWAAAAFQREANLTPTAGEIMEITSGESGGFNRGKKLDIQSQWGWKSNVADNIPASATGPLIYKLPGRLNAAGEETYALQSTFEFDARSSNGKISATSRDFKINLRPIKEIACTGNHPPVSYVFEREADKITSLGGSGGGCIDHTAFVEHSGVGWAAGFKEQFPIRLKVKLPSSLGGWFQGRVDSPDIQLARVDDKTNLATFVGSPTTVPITSKQVAVDNPAVEPIVKAIGGNVEDLKNAQALGSRGPTGPVWTPRNGVGWFNAWAANLGETARGKSTLWSFSHFQSDQRCMGDVNQLQGLVTTNAMVYQADAPTFEDGFLNYKVAGQHFDSSNEVFKGTYNFILRSSVARCLYGFSNAPISGTVSVTSASGAEQVASTMVTENDGWLKLSALGFTFSSPTISVKLTQAKVAAPKKTITCVSSKNKRLIKKVTAVSPKCPAGYKTK